jgi:CHAT domain-containing protein
LHSRLSAENAERYFLHENLSFALTLLRADPSGVRFINRLVQKEVAASTNLYYKVGIEAARRIFLEYTEILAILHPNVEYKEEKDLTSLLARLSEYEKTAPLSPQSQPINPTLKQIEEVLVKSAEEQSLWKAVGIGFFLFFKLLLQQPRRIRTLFTVLLRSIRALRKNPSATMQRWERVDDMLLTIRELAQQTQQPGEVLTQLHPELTDFVESTFPYPSYPAKNLVRDLQGIRTLNGVDTEEASEQLLGEWVRLAEQRDLPSHPALWTAICMALGDFALKKQLFGVAKRAYAKPLGKSILWRSDLGTRYVCAAKLGELYCEHGSNLEMSTSQLARALHDVYLDMLRVNERLYQRSPYQDSKRKLQARNDFIMARALEACVYLSMHCEEAELVHWRREAFVIAESGKSRMLREEMALAERLPPKEMPAHLCEIEERSLAHLRAIYAEMATRRPGRSFEEFQAERNELRLDLEQTWAEMEDYGDEARAYVIARRDEALQWEGLQWDSFQRVAEHLGEQFAIVSISMLPEAVLLSVLRSGWEAPKLRRVSLSQNDLQDRYLESYEKEILNRKPSEKVFLKHEWQRLGDVLFAPLEPLLDGVNYVYFLPHGKLHKLPLHALTIRDEPFIKHWEVAYAPSISVLESTLSRPKRQGPVLVMGYADPNDPRKIVTKFILEEAKKIATFFHSPYVLPEAVNAQILRKEGQPASLIHLACHGIFTAKDPLNSGVVLADGTFTACDWLQLQLQADLVTLSACQVGISDIRPGDDLVGLTRSILFAGASSLLMTLWSVDSIATYDWMLLFYQNLQKNDDPARKIDAFKNATLALLEEYNDPYYWAPFVLVGHP